MSGLTNFLGDTPLRVLIKLIVISFLVGLVMSAFGWTPLDLVDRAYDVLLRIWESGFATIDRFLGYMLVGAAIVVPVFIVLRLMKYRL